MKLVLSWMRDFVTLPDGQDAAAVAARLAACGFEVAEIIDTPEPAIDFEITANRPDCLSVVGLAREAGVAYRSSIGSIGSSGSLGSTGSAAVDVEIVDPDLCPRYAAQVARVKVAPSPGWMQQRLLAAGIRPINNIVDITNYVMLERGHPLHAFDLDKLAGRKIVVRRARPGEKLKTLDDVERTLDRDMLVIADAERAAAVAGVMGGADSEVSPGTTTIALESAWFLPRSVRITSRRLGLKTEASARFERGADIEVPLQAIARVMDLVRETGAGEPAGPIVDRYPVPAERRRILLRADRIARLLGAPVPDLEVERILPALGFALENGGDGARAWQVTVPSWRVDAAREADLIEEVGRHYGYDRLPTTFPVLRDVAAAPDPRIDRDRLVRRVLTACGLTEAVTLTFIERKAAEPFAPADAPAVAIANPLSEKFAVLRPSLLPGLVDAVAYNRRHGRVDVRLFEIGSCFSAAAGEQRRVGLAWTGSAIPEHWSHPSRPADFFDVRGAVEALGQAYSRKLDFVEAGHEYLVPGRTADVRDDGRSLGLVGQLLPAIGESRDVPGDNEIYVAELDLDALGATIPTLERMQPLPRFPSIVRDLSILVSDRLPAADVRGTIRTAAPSTLVDVQEFDRYQGKGIPEGRVSLSWHLTFRASERTLTDAEVDDAMGAIVHALETAHGAVRR